MREPPSPPIATYRLQFNSDFTFRDAEGLVPYLHRLGVSHVYASSFLKARPGSTHGYDIIDHNALNPELGTPEEFDRFCAALQGHGMGLLLDFVPNHMGIGRADNEWWLDVLEWGQSSIYAEFFDIDWMPLQRKLQGKVLVPFLGDHYGTVLESGELALRFDSATGSFSAWYHEHRFPVRPRDYAIVLRRYLASPASSEDTNDALRARIERLAAEFDRLRRPSPRQRAAVRERANQLKRELAALCAGDPAAAGLVDGATERMNGIAGDPRSFRQLHALLERQWYRLAFWRVAADEINYRRFFNINELAGIRIENATLFELTHRLVGRLIAEGKLHGLRLDHVDGLFDPETYCRRLQAFAARARAGTTTGAAMQPFYIVVEKILAHHENLRESWPISGTTGYEFTSLVNGLFVDPAGRRGLERAYRQSIGRVAPFEETLAAAKSQVIDDMLASELNVLANELDRISECHWSTRDYTNERLRAALKAIVAQFPVYRTYVTDKGPSAEDRRDIDWAVSQARRHWRGPDPEILDFVHAALTAELARRGGPYRRVDVLRFAAKFQQYSGPVMAKSLEDTSFYRHFLLLSVNEVGGDPRQFSVSPAAFHHANRQRARQWPGSMLTTATHDTKRGEDARLRLDVLSEMPAAWEQRVRRWRHLNRFQRRDLDGQSAPSRNDEYMIYQTLVGAWPTAMDGTSPDPSRPLDDLAERVKAYVVKAAREAKVVTSWDSPNAAYESACTAFVQRLLDGTQPNPFLADFAAFQAEIADFGMFNGLSQVVLKLTAPGIPDIYQGTEHWDLSLVDPDNRRPVDFARRREDLAGLEGLAALPPAERVPVLHALRADWRDGRIKLYLIHRLLRLRQELPDLFHEGGYEPLQTAGAQSGRVVAFMRGQGEQRLLVVAGRLFAGLAVSAQDYEGGAAWGDTTVTCPREIAGPWQDAVTGSVVEIPDGEGELGLQLSGLLATLPVAVLVGPPT